jgi:cytosine/adenosine deaminase-related metal-dependent hydrolase
LGGSKSLTSRFAQNYTRERGLQEPRPDRLTRGSAYTILQEHNLGSLAPGKMADLVVIERDYLAIPEDEVKEITSVITMVGGRGRIRRRRASHNRGCALTLGHARVHS